MKDGAIVSSYDDIRNRRDALRVRCAVRMTPPLPVQNCWCYCQGPNGSHLPCPNAPQQPAPDPNQTIRERIKAMFGPPFWQEPR